jgi:hypothetical protein
LVGIFLKKHVTYGETTGKKSKENNHQISRK